MLDARIIQVKSTVPVPVPVCYSQVNCQAGS